MCLPSLLSRAALVLLAASAVVVPCLPAADEAPDGVIVTLRGQKEAVYGVAFSPDGKFLLTGSGDPALKVWSLPDGKEVKNFAGPNGHKQLVLAVAVSADGTQFASGGSDNTARVWDFPSSKHLREFLTSDQPRAVAVSPDGKRLAGGSKDGKVRVYNTDDGKQLYEVAAHTGAVTGLAFSPNAQVLVSAGADSTLHYFNAPDGKPLARFAAHTGAVTGLAYSPGNNLVFTTGQDGTLRFWSTPPVASRSLAAPFKDALTALALSPDGAQVVVASDKLVRVAALANGQTTRELTGAPAAVGVVAASPGSALVAAGSDRRVLVWQTKDGKLLGQAVAHTGAVTGLAFNPAGNQLVTAGKDGKVRLWTMPPVAPRSLALPDVVRAAVLSPDGKSLAAAGADKVVRLYTLDNLKMPQRQLSGHTAPVNALALSADGKIASAGDGGVIRFWTQAKGEQTAAIGAHTGPVHSLALVGTTLVLSASADGSVKLWQTPPPAGKATLSHAGPVTSAVLSPDGAKLLTGCDDKQVRLWNLTTAAVERTWTGPTLAVQAVAFSPKGDRVAAGSADKAVHVWEAASNKEVKKFDNLPAAVQAVALSSDGKHAAAGLADGSVRVFDLAMGKEVNAITGHKGAVEAVLFTAKGDQVVYGGAEGVVHVQPLTAKAPAATWKVGAAVRALAASRDGLRVAVGGTGKDVKVFTLATGKLEATVTTPAEVRGLGFGPTGKRVVVAGGDGKARVYTLDGRLQEYVSHDGAVHAAAISTDGKRVLTASADKTARVSPLLLLWQGRHDGAVRQAVVNARGDRVLSAGDDGLVRTWNLADGKPLQSIRAHKGAVAGLAVTADSSRIVTAGADKAARVWDWAKMPPTKTAAAVVEKPAIEMSLPGSAQAVTISPNSQRIAVSVPGAKPGEGRVHVFDPAGKELVALGDGDALPGRVLAFLGDSRTLLAAGDKAVELVDVNVVASLDAHAGGVAGVAFHNNGTQVLTGGADRTAKLWTLTTGKLERTFGPLTEGLSAIGFSRDFAYVAATAGKTLKVWNLADGKDLHSIALPAAVRGLAFNSDRTRVATADADGRARVWDLATRKEAQGFLHTGAVVGVAFHPFQPAQMVSAGADRTVGIHTLSLARLIATDAALNGLAVPPGVQHVVTAGADGKIGFYNTGNGARDRFFAGDDKGVTSVAVSRNGVMVAAGGVDRKVHLFNYNDPKMLSAFTAPAAPRALVFSPTSQALVAAGADGSLTTYDTVYNPGQPVPPDFGKVLQQSAHGKEAFAVGFPVAGAIFYSAGDDKGVKAWKLASDAPVRTFNHPNTVNALAYNKTGTQLVTGCGDGRVRLFDLTKGTLLREIIAHPTMNQTAIYCVAFSPDDKQVVSGSMDQSLKLFNVADGKLVREFKAYKEKVFDKGHQDSVLSVAFSPDGKQIASGSMDKAIKVWNVADGNVVRDLANPNLKPAGAGLPHPAHPGWVYGLRWTAGGKQLVSAGQAPRLHGYLAVWDATSGKLLWGKELSLGSIFSLAVAPDEKSLAIGTGGSVRTGEELNLGVVLRMPGSTEGKKD
jgi:WD40 repeat protein